MGAVIEIHADPVPLETWDDGSIRVEGTRLLLEVLLGHHRQGMSAEQLTEEFETLSLADAHAVIAYALRHPDEVATYLADREALAERNRALFEPQTRELLAKLRRRRKEIAAATGDGTVPRG